MFGGKKKAITFSYDDGVTQDIRLIEILDRYGLKATFNLNSQLLGMSGQLICDGVKVAHNKVASNDVAKIYKNHEIAVHTLTHPNLTTLDDTEIIRQVEDDRLNLSKLCGYEVIGMAYPCGGVNNDDRVAQIIKNNTGVKYARTITSSHNFEKRNNLYRFNPTAYHLEKNHLMRLAEEFLKLDTNASSVFYIWGHSYEFDIEQSWDWFEDFCRLIGGHDNVFYGTNREVICGNSDS